MSRWLYGHTGCQLYAAAGFFFGIGVIISLGLIVLEGFTIIFGNTLISTLGIKVNTSGLAPTPRSNHHSLLMIVISWMYTSLFVIPPYLDIFGM